jgi:membrane protein YdbS with pleckstrin-like domain
MDNSNQESVSVPQESSIQEMNWQSVDPAYRKLLRFYVLIQMLVIIPASVFFIWVMPEEGRTLLLAFMGVYLLLLIWQLFIWVPRTAQRLQYCLREDDINLQKGFMYWRQVSVACNRIQHLEVSQGPLERYLGLATLSVFTAGTLGSDMKLPGLTLESAQKIKARLLNKINAEEIESDESL